ncbi:MAG: hypothetical protein ACE5G9_04960 [Nitrospinales bacterium]
MQEEPQVEPDDEPTLKWMKKILTAAGCVFVAIGIIRQWPILGKTYMEFIEGDGYLSLILGLIMIVLGFSVRLLVDSSDEDPGT